MKNSLKKWLIGIGIVAAAAVAVVIMTMDRVEDFHYKYEGVDLTADVEGAVREGTYTRYLNAHQGAARPAGDVEVDLFSYVSGEDIEVYTDYEGEQQALYTATPLDWGARYSR